MMKLYRETCARRKAADGHGAAHLHRSRRLKPVEKAEEVGSFGD